MVLYSAANSSFDPWAKKQIIRFFFGIIILFVIALIDIRFWYKYAIHIFILSIWVEQLVSFTIIKCNE